MLLCVAYCFVGMIMFARSDVGTAGAAGRAGGIVTRHGSWWMSLVPETNLLEIYRDSRSQFHKFSRKFQTSNRNCLHVAHNLRKIMTWQLVAARGSDSNKTQRPEMGRTKTVLYYFQPRASRLMLMEDSGSG